MDCSFKHHSFTLNIALAYQFSGEVSNYRTPSEGALDFFEIESHIWHQILLCISLGFQTPWGWRCLDPKNIPINHQTSGGMNGSVTCAYPLPTSPLFWTPNSKRDKHLSWDLTGNPSGTRCRVTSSAWRKLCSPATHVSLPNLPWDVHPRSLFQLLSFLLGIFSTSLRGKVRRMFKEYGVETEEIVKQQYSFHKTPSLLI